MALFTPSTSPAITVREIDLTGVSPNVETSIAGFVGDFKWGPVDQPVRIQNEGELASTFGTPDQDKAVDYFSAAAFLQYSSNLIVCRQIVAGEAGEDSCTNAVSGTAKAVVKNEDDYEAQKSTLSAGGSGQWIAKYPGELGNSLAVSIFAVADGDSAGDTTATESNFANWDYAGEFSTIPGTSPWAEDQSINAINDEVHVVVVDEDGAITGTKGSVLERFPFVSIAKNAKTSDGSTNYMPEVVNRASNYIWFGGYDSATSIVGDNWGLAPDEVTLDSADVADYASGVVWSENAATDSLAQGADSQVLTASEFAEGFDNFEDPDTIDVQILIAPGMSGVTPQVTVVNDLVAIAAGIRKDCVVVASPDRAAVVNNANPVTDTLLTVAGFTSSNYLIVDNNYLKVYDKYNDQYIFIPAASSTAGILAATDANFGPWFSPAGQKRGNYLGVVGLAYSATKSERDQLYKAGVNSIVQLPGQGTILFGDKTKESRPSAFDRINVRRLFLAVEKSVALAARNIMFEFNDEFTRAEFVGVIEPVLREIQARRGITDYYIQCDESNNTPAVIDRNELVASIFIKPARSINYITLNFVAVRSGVAFEEVVGTV